MCDKHNKYKKPYEKLKDKFLMIFYMSGRLKGDIALLDIDLNGL